VAGEQPGAGGNASYDPTRGRQTHIIGVGVVEGKLCWRERCESLLRFRRDYVNGNMCLHGSTGRPLRDGNFGALRAASRLQYHQRAIRTPSDKKSMEPIAAVDPPLTVAARKSIMPTLAALSLDHLQTAIAAHHPQNTQPSSNYS
jgi:hypothetical protein